MIDTVYLERQRLKNGETQTELAKRLGMTQATYCSIVKRKTALPRTIKKLIKCLQLDPDKLIPDPKEER